MVKLFMLVVSITFHLVRFIKWFNVKISAQHFWKN